MAVINSVFEFKEMQNRMCDFVVNQDSEIQALKALVEDSNDDGWIKWINGTPPVEDNVVVKVRIGDRIYKNKAEIFKSLWNDGGIAENGIYCNSNITAYKIVKDKPTSHNLSEVEDRYHYGYKDGLEFGRNEKDAQEEPEKEPEKEIKLKPLSEEKKTEAREIIARMKPKNILDCDRSFDIGDAEPEMPKDYFKDIIPPKKHYKLSEMWKVWFMGGRDGIIVNAVFTSIVVAKSWMGDRGSLTFIAITRADATEFYEGEGL